MEVLLRVDPLDGNDPIEAVVDLPIVPREGDIIEMWDDEGGSYSHAGDRTGESHFPTVDQVVLTTYAPERVEVWLKFELFDLDEVKRVMAGAQRGDTP